LGEGHRILSGGETSQGDKSDRVGDVAPPEKHVVATLLETLPEGLAPKGKKILVRSEYSEAEQAAVLFSRSDLDAFMVSGQPDIGPLYCPQNLM